MKVELLQHSSLDIIAHAIRTCWQSFNECDSKQPISRKEVQRRHLKNIQKLLKFYKNKFQEIKNQKFNKISKTNSQNNFNTILLKNIFGNNNSEQPNL